LSSDFVHMQKQKQKQTISVYQMKLGFLKNT
jgi:hypothetical protein